MRYRPILHRLSLSSLTCLAMLSAAPALGLEAAFIEKGKPGAVIEEGAQWKRADGYLEQAGTNNYLYAARSLDAGDFQIRARLSIAKLEATAASFVLDDSHFGFDGRNGEIFIEGPLFPAKRAIAKSLDFLADGKPFEVTVERKGDLLTFRIDGKALLETECESNKRINLFGLRPWRGTLCVYDFSATGNLAEPLPISKMEKDYTIPLLDLSQETDRQVVVARGTDSVYQGHPHTVLMADGKTVFAAWTYNHGGACGPIKRSDDGGLTWSDLLDVPENWSTIRNCPTLHRIADAQGRERLFAFAGNGDMYQSVSEDGGQTWTPMRANGLKCIVAPMSVIAVEGGRKHLMWVHRGKDDLDRLPLEVWQSESTDGGLTWGNSRRVCAVAGANPCEPAVVRSPDGKQLLCLMRENARRLNSLMMTSDDEGRTWSEARELTASLTGDRHCPRYAPDGRLVIPFRDMATESPTKGHFVAWVGTYEDIIAGREGQYRLVLLRQYGRLGDCGYNGLECLADGTMVTTTYVKYRPGTEQNTVVSVRFKMEELDAKAAHPPQKQNLFSQGEGNYNNYRIPALIVTPKGTLLAFAEGRSGGDSGDLDTILRRSEDGGKTWSPYQVVWDDGPNTCGNPCPVVDRDTGRVWLLSTWNRGDDHEGLIIQGTSKDTRRVFICYSDDDGVSWSKPKDITDSVKPKEWGWYATGPGVGIQLRHGAHKGRLVIPCDHSTPDDYGAHTIYSDDHGATWKRSAQVLGGANECQVAELDDGRLMLNIRMQRNHEGSRGVALSFDGGETWGAILHDKNLPAPVCQASLLRASSKSDGADRNRLLFSSPTPDARKDMTVRLSYDEGDSWSHAKLLHKGPAAYSCLTVLPGGEYACFYEGGTKGAYDHMIFARFPLAWLHDETTPEKQSLFTSGQDGYHTYRIPALVVTNEMTLLAFCEGRKNSSSDAGDIDTVLKRSTDGGRTWGPQQVVWGDGENTSGNPCAVVDRDTGTIWLVNTWGVGSDHEGKIHNGTSQDTRRVFVHYSTDDGKTWVGPKEITQSVKKPEWVWVATGPGAGIQLEKGPHKGRLIIPSDQYLVNDPRYWSYCIYSDDHGATWQFGEPVGDMNNECEAVELADGTLMLNARSWRRDQTCRTVALSRDGGMTWGEPWAETALIDPRCQASIRRYSLAEDGGKNRLLFLNAASTSRERMALKLSYDEGQTWPVEKVLHTGPAAYSCLAVLPDGMIGCFYEGGEKHAYQNIYFQRVPLEWLTDGKDSAHAPRVTADIEPGRATGAEVIDADGALLATSEPISDTVTDAEVSWTWVKDAERVLTGSTSLYSFSLKAD